MSMKKKALMAASYVMVAAMAIGGTVAFLTDEEHDVNVMTLGNVDIEQHEYERKVDENGKYVTNDAGYVLTDFTQLKPLIPSTGGYSGALDNVWDEVVVPFDQIGGKGSMQILANNDNAQDKFVVVENTGTTDAYVRTIIAYEAGSKTLEEWNKLVMTSTHKFWSANDIGIAEIDGTNYAIVEYYYNSVLEAGAVSRSSLSQIYLMPQTTSEDVEALDGNGNGTYDILVVSQAVQADNKLTSEKMLDEAFGDITTSTHPWSDAKVTKPVVYTKGEHTITGNVTVAEGEKADPIEASGANTVVNIIGGTYNSADPDCAVWAHDGATINIYGGEYTCGECADVTNHHSDLIYAGSKADGTTGYINIYGGTFSAAVAGDWLLNEADNLGEITVYGGTFKNFDPSNNVAEGPKTNFVAEGYEVVKTQDGDDIWYTVVKAD